MRNKLKIREVLGRRLSPFYQRRFNLQIDLKLRGL